MSKGNRNVRHKARKVTGKTPAKGVPYPIQNRVLREHFEEVKRVANKTRRLLWMAVQKAGGRIELSREEVEIALLMDEGKCNVTLEPVIYEKSTVIGSTDKPRSFALILTDEHGKRLEASDPKLIIEL